ncbi:TonB-dependent receptor [Pelagibacteraceae bacterium]|nr:TonB-dependent receptor [Pelagibacteraceae bacterium]
MTKKLVLSIFIFITLIGNISAETPEILINPSSEEYTRLQSGLAGSNITIISKEDLKLNQNKSLPKIIESYSGISTRSTAAGYDGVYTTLDMRGFGEVAKSNTLILINGRRLNDIDMSTINSHIPTYSIERIEIIRGGSAATLYGSGAVGGAINIVTNNEDINNSLKTSIGSYNNKSADLSLFTKINDQSSASLFGSQTRNSNYRDAADFDESNILLNIKHKVNNITLSIDVMSMENEKDLPGGRIKGGEVYNYHICNRYEDSKTARNLGGSSLQNGNSCNTERRVDYANTEMDSINANFIVPVNDLNKIFIHLGYRDKTDKSFFGANSNTASTPNNNDRYTVTTIDGNNFNSRYETKQINETHSNILSIGYDFAHSFYDSTKHRKEDEAMGQQIFADLKVRSLYFQNTTYINESDLSISLGYRDEKSIFEARDDIYKTAPGFADVDYGEYGIFPAIYNMKTHNNTTSNQAFNVGFEKKLNRELSLYAGYAESFRIPNIDERVASSSPKLTFDLKSQESEGYDVGLRYFRDELNLDVSYYVIDTTNEIQLRNNINANIDPIERKGLDIDFGYSLDQSNKLRGSFSYTIAEFTAGTLTPGVSTYGESFAPTTWQNLLGGVETLSLKGKSVPLISPIQFSLAYETEVRDNLTLDVELNYFDKKYVSNDEENIEPQIPDYYFVNTYLSSVNTNYTLNFGINNLFDEAAYDFAVSSTFHNDAHYGLSNVYPLPERNLFFDLAYTF